MPEPADAELLIDEVCDRFEGCWRAGERPVVEDYLGTVPAAATDELLRELLRLEIDYRRRRGEQPALGDYLPRWPAQSTLLQELLGEVLPAPQAAPALAPAPVALELTASYQGTLPGDSAGLPAPADERITRAETSSDERITRVLPPPAVPALPEQLGRYKVNRLLRQGGTGTVYVAEDALADRQVAIKVPNVGPGSPPTALERFRSSARAAARLAHPNLCPIYEVGEWQGAPFLVMPHLALPSLADRLKDGPPFAPREAAELVRKLATAMQAAHQAGVIHRDLNPANILLDAEGEPIVVDFGLALFTEGDSCRLTQAGEVLGTPAYIAPEQLGGNPEAHTASCDVFSLGVILHELLTGEPPFGRTLGEVRLRIMTHDPAPSALRPEVGPELDGVCRKALAYMVQDRFRSMAELADALPGSPVRQEDSTARGETRIAVIPHAGPLLRRARLLLAATVLGALAVLVAGWLWVKVERKPAPVAQATPETPHDPPARQGEDKRQEVRDQPQPVRAPRVDEPKPVILRPTLLMPRPGGTMKNGYQLALPSMVWFFNWSQVPGAERYHLLVRDPKGVPVIDDASAGTPPYALNERDVFVADSNLVGWRWKLRALVKGEWTEWSVERTFNVAPFGKNKSKPGGWYTRVAYSLDGRSFASACSTGEITVWNTATGQISFSLPTPMTRAEAVAFSPDGKWLAGAGAGLLLVWDAETRKEVYLFPVGGDSTSRQTARVAFSPDSKFLASACDDCIVRVWDLTTGRVSRRLFGLGVSDRKAVAFNKHGSLLASTSNQSVGVWNVQTGRVQFELPGHAWCVEFSPDGGLLAAGGNSGVKVWDVATGKEVMSRPGDGRLQFPSLAFSPNDKRLAVTTNAGLVLILDPLSGKELQRLRHGNSWRLLDVAFSRDGTRVLSAGWGDGSIVVHDAATGKELSTVPRKENVRPAQPSPPGGGPATLEARERAQEVSRRGVP
jgi:DNA-binding beta-propeller fold protein YncE